MFVSLELTNLLLSQFKIVSLGNIQVRFDLCSLFSYVFFFFLLIFLWVVVYDIFMFMSHIFVLKGVFFRLLS